jgi:hypothetical protein
MKHCATSLLAGSTESSEAGTAERIGCELGACQELGMNKLCCPRLVTQRL